MIDRLGETAVEIEPDLREVERVITGRSGEEREVQGN